MMNTELNNKIDYRRDNLLNGNTLELAIEGRFTNLRIWSCKKENTIFIRLDRANQYSAPLSNQSIWYLEKQHPSITKLNELFGFNHATLDDIDTILEITKDMKYRACIPW